MYRLIHSYQFNKVPSATSRKKKPQNLYVNMTHIYMTIMMSGNCLKILKVKSFKKENTSFLYLHGIYWLY